jgi:hypothetical protein
MLDGQGAPCLNWSVRIAHYDLEAESDSVSAAVAARGRRLLGLLTDNGFTAIEHS